MQGAATPLSRAQEKVPDWVELKLTLIAEELVTAALGVLPVMVTTGGAVSAARKA